MECTCNHEELYGCIQEGELEKIEALVNSIETCSAEKHAHDIRLKEKLYLVAHAKEWPAILKRMSQEQLDFFIREAHPVFFTTRP